jgi:hypothetical protein
VIKRETPWQVRSAVRLAHPASTWQSYMQWEPNEWIAVTATDDLETKWWWIVEEPAGEFSIYPVAKD